MQRFILLLLIIILSPALIGAPKEVNDSKVISNYTLKFSSALDEVQVTIEIKGSINFLRARDSYSEIFSHRPKTCDKNETLEFRDELIHLDSSIECIKYTAILNQKLERNAFGTEVLVTKPSEWLFLPGLTNSKKVELKVNYSDGFEFSTPWEIIDESNHRYQLTASRRTNSHW